MRRSTATPNAARRVCAAVLACVVAWSLPGCIVFTAIGGMAESYRRTGSRDVQAEYIGLTDKSFTVVVTADRMTMASHQGLVPRVNQRVNDRLLENLYGVAAAGIPSDRLLRVLYNTPQWPIMPPGEVADMLGVERLVWVEIVDYRLTEPGNQYLWDGVASAIVSVYEADGGLPDDAVFQKSIRVTFPDMSGMMQTELSEAAVTSELSNRLVNRIAWLFYDHEEPNTIPY